MNWLLKDLTKIKSKIILKITFNENLQIKLHK